jgi:hypothetical protein
MIFKKGFGRNGVSSNRSLASKGAAKKRNGQQGFHFRPNFSPGPNLTPKGHFSACSGGTTNWRMKNKLAFREKARP